MVTRYVSEGLATVCEHRDESRRILARFAVIHAVSLADTAGYPFCK